MRTGQLQSRIAIQRDYTQPGPSGKLAGQAWREPVDIAIVSARLEQETGNENVLGGVSTGTGRYRVTLHRRDDITRECRFAVRESNLPDRILNIVSIAPAVGLWMSVICEEAA